MDEWYTYKGWIKNESTEGKLEVAPNVTKPLGASRAEGLAPRRGLGGLYFLLLLFFKL